ncbi:S8 family serine peptidase [Microbacterium indicum]|uniref:S8 family serine peptidase n=1 Tax=Microbacterium indicum TaxID=358100 RepID=UPI0004088075|nr:S8 family serine peptidase [Microbacterium indicum]
MTRIGHTRRALVAALVLACAILAAPPAAAETTESPTPTPTPTEDPIRAGEYWLDQYGISDAWEHTRGAGTTVAVIDSGVASGIPELDGAVTGGHDASGVGSADGRTSLGADVETRSHGTWVASLLASRGDGEEAGLIGVAPEADILSVSLGFGSVSDVPFSDQLAEAMKWAVDNGADVINLSFTTNQTSWDESWDDAFTYAYDHDVVVVASAGNRGSGTTMVGAPATIPGVLVVGGVDPSGHASDIASTQGITIGVSAPSEDLLGIGPSGDVEEWSGTSAAAPIVSGIAALIRSEYPNLDANNVIERIIKTAEPAPDQDGGRDPLYGFGIVDADAALTDDVARVDSNPMGDLATWIRLNRGSDSAGEIDGAEPTPDPVTLPALPPADEPATASSPWIPSAESMREVTLPLAAASLGSIGIVLGVVASFRRIRVLRAGRASRPSDK